MAPALLAAIPAIAQTAGGLFQTLFSGRKKNQRALERMQDPTYEGSKPVSSFYNQALARYNVDPTSSALYKRQQRDIGRGAASGLRALRDRRSGLAGVSGLVRGMNDASLNANTVAEQEKNRRFGELGTASRMKLEDDRYAFNQNQLKPFERKNRLAMMKAAGSANVFNSGLDNIYGGVSDLFGSKKKGLSSMDGMSGGGNSGGGFTMDDYRAFRRFGQ